MIYRVFRHLFILAFAVVLTIGPRSVFGCGPFFEEAIFVATTRPDIPYEKYLNGQLGVIDQRYEVTFLIAAYRELSGIGLNSAQQAAFMNVWIGQLNHPVWPWAVSSSELTKWIEARDRAVSGGSRPQLEVYAPTATDSYQNFLNCPNAAFQTATDTLSELVSRMGAGSPAVQQWVEAQDQVFSNCSGHSAVIPAALTTSDSNLMADRNYQIGAAHFYARDYDEARTIFLKIANDKNSRWHSIAPYLAARCLIRKAAFAGPEGGYDPALLAQAEKELQQVTTDPEMAAVRNAAQGMLNHVEFYLHPEARFQQLANTLMQSGASSGFAQDIWDYRQLFRQGRVAPENDLTDWLRTFTSSNHVHALERWRKTKSTPWLLAAIASAQSKDSDAAELIMAATAIRPTDAAFVSLNYHSVRLMMESGKKEEARKRLDSLIEGPSGPPSAFNRFLAQRDALAQNYSEFLKFALRLPVATSFDSGDLPDEAVSPEKANTMLFDEAALILNQRIPLNLLQQAASSSELPENLRKQVALATWVRAVLIDNTAVSLPMSKIVGQDWPQLKADMAAYEAANDDDRKFTAIVTILRNPGLRPYVEPGFSRSTPIERIDNLRDNWWCADLGAEMEAPNYAKLNGISNTTSKTQTQSPDFLDSRQKETRQHESETLSQIGTAPNFLGHAVIEWGSAHPTNPLLPEALHLVVRSTRFGCVDSNSRTFSKRAFNLLHSRYANSEWAKKTPYWY
ncbi:MAG TPA: hypothetical protein VHR84_05695 [Terriglobales bacterium]|jgi:hypothetical protein|nr:hypothetical protein [Terriglobales bacterium]